MATRRERVLLELEDRFTTPTLRAAAATKVLKGELDGLSGTAVRSGKDLDRSAQGAKSVGDSAGKSGPEIDRFSGRLRAFADAALLLGPAAIRLGAGSIPVLTGSLVGLGAAAGGIGAAVLAFNGLGDALGALSDYRLEPTAENLQKLRLEAEKMGPAGMDFARYLSSLEPALRNLQNVAREGMFPGLEDGIDALLTRGPQVSRIIGELAQGMGDIARDSGQGLASEKWTPFFDYVESDARPTLEAFAASIGNVSLGVANLLVAFAPLTRDFTGGLEGMTEAFADWSANLDSNQSFQEFLDYVRESGPAAVDFLGAIAQALGALMEAAAPLGSAVLPALTGMANAFAAIAGSPIGPGLYTAAAAMVAFNRAASLAESTSTRFSASWSKMSRLQMAQGGIAGLGLLAAGLTDVDDKAGLANTSLGSMAGLMAGGPWGLAIGTAAGQFLDFSEASDQATASIEAANGAIRSNDMSAVRDNLASLTAEYDKLFNGDAKITDFGSQLDAVKGSFLEWTGQAGRMRGAISELEGAMQSGGNLADLFGETIGQTGDQMRVAANSAEEFSGALARLNGWFDKRDAVRGYKDAIDALKEGFKDGFTRDDVANIDAVGRSMLQVAESIKNPALRQDFLQGARASLENIADSSGPKAKRAIEEVLGQFDKKGLTTKPIEITADDSQARSVIKRTNRDMDILGRSVVEPTVTGDDNPWKSIYGKTRRDVNSLDGLTGRPTLAARDNASGIISAIANALNNLDGKTATTYVRTVRQEFTNPQARAGGGFISGPGTATSDSIPALLSNGEYVVKAAAVQKYGRHAFDSLNAMRYASGGSVPHGGKDGKDADPKGVPHLFTAFAPLIKDIENVGKGLKGLKSALDRAAEAQEKMRDRVKKSRDAAVGRRDALSSSIQQGLGADPWADRESVGDPWAAGSIMGGKATASSAIASLQESTDRARRLIAALNTLKQKGITGPVLAEIIGTGDVERAEMMAALDIGTLTQFSTVFTENQSTLAAAGLAGGNAVEGANVAATNKELRQTNKELREVRHAVIRVQHAIDSHDKNNQRAQKKNSDDVKDGLNGTARDGRRRGNRGRR